MAARPPSQGHCVLLCRLHTAQQYPVASLVLPTDHKLSEAWMFFLSLWKYSSLLDQGVAHNRSSN